MLRRLSISFSIGVFLFAGFVSLAQGDDEANPVEPVFRAFLKAFANADLGTMGQFYAPKIKILKGSTLLDKKYGELGGEDGKTKDKVVSREALIAAYDIAFEAFGGRERWAQRCQKILKVDALFFSRRSPNGEQTLKALGLMKDDVIVILSPARDPLLYAWRKIDDQWLIVVEAWD